MPWDNGTRKAAAAGLRYAARSGHFVPGDWNVAIETSDSGGVTIYGCGWGHVAWMVAAHLRGTAYARLMVPLGAGQTEVNTVLREAGLTRAEIKHMDPRDVWENFDAEIEAAYKNRRADWATFINVSMRLAEFFVQVIEMVPECPEPEPIPCLTKAGQRVSLWASLLPFFEKSSKELVDA
jgi:hypothetical protein